MPLEQLMDSLPAEMFSRTADDDDSASADQKVTASSLTVIWFSVTILYLSTLT